MIENTDLQRAIELLKNDELSIAICNGEVEYTSTERGVAPVLKLIESNVDLNGFSVADKVVGKAVAMLFVLVGIKAVYASVISESALEFLEKNNIGCTYDKLTRRIQNRSKDGLCPMESAVMDSDDPVEAYSLILKALEKLQAN